MIILTRHPSSVDTSRQRRSSGCPRHRTRIRRIERTANRGIKDMFRRRGASYIRCVWTSSRCTGGTRSRRRYRCRGWGSGHEFWSRCWFETSGCECGIWGRRREVCRCSSLYIFQQVIISITGVSGSYMSLFEHKGLWTWTNLHCVCHYGRGTRTCEERCTGLCVGWFMLISKFFELFRSNVVVRSKSLKCDPDMQEQNMDKSVRVRSKPATGQDVNAHRNDLLLCYLSLLHQIGHVW